MTLSCRHIIAGLSPASGGPSYSVPALAEALAGQGNLVSIYALQDQCSTRLPIEDTVPVHRFERSKLPWMAMMQGSAGLSQAVDAAVNQGDVIHNHGLWLLPNLYAAWHLQKKPESPSKLIHAPRGMLGDAARKISSWKKEPIWWLWQKRALQSAHCLHATAESEYAEMRAAGLTNPVAIIPNGIHLPPLVTRPATPQRQKVVLSLGRIHPKKGLDRLIRAWARIEDRYPDWCLRLVGNAEIGHDAELAALASQLNLKRVEILPAVYGDAKWQMFHETDLFVLPTLNENFGITVAEALACEIPVISTKGAPWQGLEVERCGWWIDHGPDAIADALTVAMGLDPDARAEMGKRGRAWMMRDFAWPAIGAEMAGVYDWLCHGGNPPPCVRLT